MSFLISSLLAFAAGTSIVVQQALNANLRTALNSAAWSGFVSYFVGLLCMVVLVVVLRDPIPSATMAARIPWWAWSGGMFGAIFIALGILLVPKIGAATFIALLVAGQMLASVAFDHFEDVSRRSDPEIAAFMRELEIDIAVDLMGYTNEARPGIFACRAAPVQMSYLGYPGTLGTSFMDYILADEFVIPPEAQRYYAEKVLYLPECFQANDDRCVVAPRPTRAAEGLPDDAFVFCCINNNYKINPPVFDSWMRLLQATPASVLWLLAEHPQTRENLRCEAQRRGVSPDRLIFAGRLLYSEHLGRLGLADLFLDTLPYNAGATASDALRVGVPVLTCAGEAFVSRMAGSLLRCLDLPELITYTAGGYERKALELAHSPQALSEVKQRLAQNLARSPLFDTGRFCRNLEAAYRSTLVSLEPR